MKSGAFAAGAFSVLLALAAGLFVGRVIWERPLESAAESVAAHAADRALDAQLLGELRDIRVLLERQAQLPRPAADGSSVSRQVEPLAAPAIEVGIEEFRTTLQQALAELRAMASSGGASLTDVVVDQDARGAANSTWEALGRGGKSGDLPDLTFSTARDIYRRFGKPDSVQARPGGAHWIYIVGTPDPRQVSGLGVEFADGYVIAVKRFP